MSIMASLSAVRVMDGFLDGAACRVLRARMDEALGPTTTLHAALLASVPPPLRKKRTDLDVAVPAVLATRLVAAITGADHSDMGATEGRPEVSLPARVARGDAMVHADQWEHANRTLSFTGGVVEGNVAILYVAGGGTIVFSEEGGSVPPLRVPIVPGRLIVFPNDGLTHHVDGAPDGSQRHLLGSMALAPSGRLQKCGTDDPCECCDDTPCAPCAMPCLIFGTFILGITCLWIPFFLLYAIFCVLPMETYRQCKERKESKRAKAKAEKKTEQKKKKVLENKDKAKASNNEGDSGDGAAAAAAAVAESTVAVDIV